MDRLLRCSRMPFPRKLFSKCLAVAAIASVAPGCDWMRKKDPPHVKGENEKRREREAQLRRANRLTEREQILRERGAGTPA